MATVALVTGASRGIGRATAETLARDGMRVVAASRSGPPVDDLGDPGPGAVADAQLDVRDRSSVDALFARLDVVFGRVDVLVNNAGIGGFGPVAELPAEVWDDVIATNLTGAFSCAQAAFARMAAGDGGRIINVGSIASRVPFAQASAYGASKYGLRGLSAILSEEGAGQNVRSTHLTVGAVWTDIWQGRERFSPADMLQPEDIARAISKLSREPLSVRIDELEIAPPRGVL